MCDRPQITVVRFVTRYALTKGILRVEGYLTPGSSHQGPVEYFNSLERDPFGHSRVSALDGVDAFAEEADACARANQMRDEKIVSLRKQLSALEAKSFVPVSQKDEGQK